MTNIHPFFWRSLRFSAAFCSGVPGLWLLLPLPLPPLPSPAFSSSAESVTSDLHVAKSRSLLLLHLSEAFLTEYASIFETVLGSSPTGSLGPSLCRIFSSAWPLQGQMAEPGAWVPLSTSSVVIPSSLVT